MSRPKNAPKLHEPQQDSETQNPANLPAVADSPSEAVLRWMTEGHDEKNIREALRMLHPEADHDAAIGEAIADLKADGDMDPQLIRGWALRAYRDLYRRCLEIGDFDGGRKVMKEITLLVR